MKLSEFKAWLDGFSDAMGDAPTPEQWAKIKAKLAQVESGLGGIPSGPIRPYWDTPVIGKVFCGDPPGTVGCMSINNGDVQ
jgi:hypothetical protein